VASLEAVSCGKSKTPAREVECTLFFFSANLVESAIEPAFSRFFEE
jgi:hypothetical protein